MVFHRRCFVLMLLCVIFLGKTCNSGIGRCPKLESMENFNMTRFTGTWYEIERSFYLMEIISSCVSMDLAENDRGHLQVDIKTKSRWSGTFTVSEGVAVQSRRRPSIFSYKVVSNLPRIVNRYLPGSGFYQVIDTDYDNYSVLWSCTNYGLMHTDLIWVWGRRTEISAEVRSKIYEHIDNLRLDSERLLLPKNKNCSDFYY